MNENIIKKNTNNILVISFVIYMILILFVIYINNYTISSDLCKKTDIFPSWYNNSTLLTTGYQEFSNQTAEKIIHNFLIPQQVYFVYNSNEECLNQIALFDLYWNDYVKSGLVVECEK